MSDDIRPLTVWTMQHVDNRHASLSHGWFCSTQTPIQDSRSTALKHLLPEEPTIYSVYGYQALQVAVDAVKRSCTATDREKFRDALGQTKLEALAGAVVFNSPRTEPNGENQGGSVIISRITGRDSYEVIK
jgi:ABC-type branched-subunit amino acid transport system substrate-binding protein